MKLITEKGKTRTEVANSIGVSKTTINEWVKKYQEHGNEAFPGKGHLHSQDEELRQLRILNKDLEEENALLKKAMAIFSRSVK